MSKIQELLERLTGSKSKERKSKDPIDKRIIIIDGKEYEMFIYPELLERPKIHMKVKGDDGLHKKSKTLLNKAS